jgi:hypothetical protein
MRLTLRSLEFLPSARTWESLWSCDLKSGEPPPAKRPQILRKRSGKSRCQSPQGEGQGQSDQCFEQDGSRPSRNHGPRTQAASMACPEGSGRRRMCFQPWVCRPSGVRMSCRRPSWNFSSTSSFATRLNSVNSTRLRFPIWQ